MATGLWNLDDVERELIKFIKDWRRYGPKGFDVPDFTLGSEYAKVFFDGKRKGISEALDSLEMRMGMQE
jgi:hypothetical protein